MKTILCYGDSNVWGCIPGSFNANTGLSARYSKDKRWTGILEKKLGEDYEVIAEGISARTTTLDEIIPGRPYKNGLTLLPACLETHYPIDLVIFWIGTNDTKIQFNRSAKGIAEGARELIHVVKACNKGQEATAPKILLINPQPIIKTPNLNPQINTDSIEKSEKIAEFYKNLAEHENCEFLDASQFVTSSNIDGVHLDEDAHKLLGLVIAKKVKQILSK